jgi:hypothetical protein
MLKTVGNPSLRFGDQTIINGNLVIGTSGKGIDFSATPGSGTSELLNDYEEGTFTATWFTGTDGTGSSIGTSTENKYVKIGRFVLVNFYRGDLAGSNHLSFSGLPFSQLDIVSTSGISADGSVLYASYGYPTIVNFRTAEGLYSRGSFCYQL